MTGKQIEHVQTLALGGMPFGGESLFEGLDILMNRGHIVPHDRPLSFQT